MRQLRDDTHLILDGEVRVYRRERSKRWQSIEPHSQIQPCLPLDRRHFARAINMRTFSEHMDKNLCQSSNSNLQSRQPAQT